MAPESTGAMAGIGADCCGSGARYGGGCAEGCGGFIIKSTAPGGSYGVAYGFGFGFGPPYLLLEIHFGAMVWKFVISGRRGWK